MTLLISLLLESLPNLATRRRLKQDKSIRAYSQTGVHRRAKQTLRRASLGKGRRDAQQRAVRWGGVAKKGDCRGFAEDIEAYARKTGKRCLSLSLSLSFCPLGLHAPGEYLTNYHYARNTPG